MIEASTTVINLLGQLLKKIRAQKAWSQEEFAGICGISVRTLQRIEGGEKANTETLRAIGSILNMEVSALLPLNKLLPEEEFTRIISQFQEQADKEAAQVEKELNILPRMLNGKELFSVVTSVEVLNTDHPNPVSEDEAATMAELIGMVRDYGDIYKELDPQQQMDGVLDITRCIEQLESFGLLVFAGKLRGHVVVPRNSEGIPLRFRQGGVFICRASDIKTITDKEGREAYCFRIPYGPVSF